MRARIVYREHGTAGQPLFENIDNCDALEFLPLPEAWTVAKLKGKRVLFINPLEVASVTVDDSEVQKPTAVVAAS